MPLKLSSLQDLKYHRWKRGLNLYPSLSISPHSSKCNPCLLGKTKGLVMSIALNPRVIVDRYFYKRRCKIGVYIILPFCVCESVMVWMSLSKIYSYIIAIIVANPIESLCECWSTQWLSSAKPFFTLNCIHILCTINPFYITGFHVNHSKLLLLWSSFVCFALSRK